MKMVQVPLIILNDGTKMPAFGLGTYSGSSGSIDSKSNPFSLGGECERAVKQAIDAGYRHFDTAYFYENEYEVGKAIKDKIAEGIIKRDNVYIVTKLWCHFHDPEKVETACRKSLENLDLEYLDCYLMHWPYGYVYQGDNVMFPKNSKGEVVLSDIDYIDTWKAMEKLVGLGLTKSIGVSNFNSQQLERLLSVANIKPVHNQIECHVGFNQKKLIKLCQDKDIVITAYSPLGRPGGSSENCDNVRRKTSDGINKNQKEYLADFMGKHNNLAKGVLNCANARSISSKLWENVTAGLNARGPPIKKLHEWKKIHDYPPDYTSKTPKYLFENNVKAIADKYKKTPAQIALRFLVELGAVPIPKSVTKSRIEENINIFDFKLDAKDLITLEAYNDTKRLFPMEHAMKSKYYPFHIEY